MNNRNYALFAMFTLPLLILSCNISTEPADSTMVALQVGGCQHGLGKSISGDSCFTYQYHDALILDFCASGNCCPDSNRFSFTHRVSQDTIVVTVSDTAAHLCRCICTYLLHVEIYNLDRDEYILLCARDDYSSQYIMYSQRIRRS